MRDNTEPLWRNVLKRGDNRLVLGKDRRESAPITSLRYIVHEYHKFCYTPQNRFCVWCCFVPVYVCMQDRVTEHRLGVTVWGVADFMGGVESLDNLVEQLIAHHFHQDLDNLLQ